MKKHYLIGFAACTLVLASCSSKNKIDDLGGGKTDDAISFSTSVKGSRGTAIENDGNIATAGGNFGVTAFLSTGDTPPYMGTAAAGAEIVFGTSWGYADPTKTCYWPDATTILDFYGYTPFAKANRKVDPTFTRAGGMVFTNYEVPTDVAKQEDFMWAYKSIAKAANVDMAFNHALVRVNFQARVTTSTMKVAIDANGITICNIKNQGTATVAVVTTPTPGPAVVWSAATGAVKINVPSTAVTILPSPAEAVPVSSNEVGKAVMLMPQTFAAWDPATGKTTAVTAPGNTAGYLEVKCKIYSTADIPTYYHGTADTFAPIYIPLSSANQAETISEIWKANNNITYTLNFGGGYAADGTPILNPTLFTTTVNNWKPVTGGDLL